MLDVRNIAIQLILLKTVVMISAQSTTSPSSDAAVDRTCDVETLLSEIRELRTDLKKVVSDNDLGYHRGWVWLPAAQKHYRVIFEMMDWNAADERCRDLSSKSHLVVVETATENNAIMEFLRSLDPLLKRSCNRSPAVTSVTYAGGYWTSGQRATLNCGDTPWVWKPFPGVVSNITFTGWHSGQPDCYNVIRQTEHFIQIGSETHWNVQWNDMNGGWPLCPLCELDL